MFPMTVTVHNRAQLDVVLQAISQTNEYAKEKAILAEPDAPEQKAGKKKEKPAQSSVPVASESSSNTNEAETSVSTAKSPSDTVKVEDVNAAIIALAKTKGRDAAVAVLKEFGVAKVPELDAAKYPDVLAAATAATGGE